MVILKCLVLLDNSKREKKKKELNVGRRPCCCFILFKVTAEGDECRWFYWMFSLNSSVFLIKTEKQNLLKLSWIVSSQESYTSVLFLLIIITFIKSAKLVSCHARGGCTLIIIILPCKKIHRPWRFPHFCQISYKLRCSRRERFWYWHRSPDYKCTPYFFKLFLKNVRGVVTFFFTVKEKDWLSHWPTSLISWRCCLQWDFEKVGRL